MIYSLGKWFSVLPLVAALGLINTPARAQTTLTIMVFQGLQNLPLLAAQSEGFFAKRGLAIDIKIAPNSDELRNGLAEGRYQIVHSAADNGIALKAMNNIDAALVIGGDNGLYHLYTQAGITQYEALRGQTVVVDAPNTAYAFQLYEMLRLKGLNAGDYKIHISGATFKRLQDLQSDKRFVATMLNPPFSLLAEKSGLKDLGEATQVLGAYQATAGFVLRAWAEKNSATLVAYLSAYIEGQRWAMDPKNKAAAITLYMNALKVSEDIALGCYNAALTGMAKDAEMDMAGLKNVLALRERHTGKPTQPAADYLELSYYHKALENLSSKIGK